VSYGVEKEEEKDRGSFGKLRRIKDRGLREGKRN